MKAGLPQGIYIDENDASLIEIEARLMKGVLSMYISMKIMHL